MPGGNGFPRTAFMLIIYILCCYFAVVRVRGGALSPVSHLTQVRHALTCEIGSSRVHDICFSLVLRATARRTPSAFRSVRPCGTSPSALIKLIAEQLVPVPA